MVQEDKIMFNIDQLQQQTRKEGAEQFDNLIKSTLSIKNASEQRNIMFKVKTTTPLNYVVKPNSGIIEPLSVFKINITFIPTPVSI